MNNRLDSLDPDQDRDIVGPDLDTNNLHCDNVPEIFFPKVSKHEQIPSKSFNIYEFVLDKTNNIILCPALTQSSQGNHLVLEVCL